MDFDFFINIRGCLIMNNKTREIKAFIEDISISEKILSENNIQLQANESFLSNQRMLEYMVEEEKISEFFLSIIKDLKKVVLEMENL